MYHDEISTLLNMYTRAPTSSVNVVDAAFRKLLIYNGPPETHSVELMFNLFVNNIGLEYAITWALGYCGVHLFEHVHNPSRKVINKAVALDNNLYYSYKNVLTEEDIIEIVTTPPSTTFGPSGWHLLYKLLPQPHTVIIAALTTDIHAIRAVKNKTSQICNFLLLERRLTESLLDNIQLLDFDKDSLDSYVLDGVISHNWSLKHLSPELMTEKLLLMVLSRNNNTDLQYVVTKRSDLINDELIKVALSGKLMWTSCGNFRYVPQHMQTIEMCRRFTKHNISNLQFVSSTYVLQDIIDKPNAMLQEDWNILHTQHVTPMIGKLVAHMSKSTRKKRYDIFTTFNEEEIMELLPLYPTAYQYLSLQQMTPQNTQRAITLSGWNIKSVPQHLYTDELFAAAITITPEAIKYAHT